MAVLALTNAFAYLHGYDFTGDTNDLKLNVDVEALDSTVWGPTSNYKSFIGGLRTSTFDLNGFWQAGTSSVDTESFADIGNVQRVLTFGPVLSETSTAYLGRFGKFGYQAFGKIGEITPFSLHCMGTDTQPLVQGQLGKAKGTVSATGALGSGLNLGAVSSTQFLYASFHVFTAATTITVVVESDTSGAFAAPTTRATIGPLTTTGGTWATRVAGSITDTWYRFRVSAITGTFTVAGAIGIG